MSYSYGELKKMNREKLIEEHDKKALHADSSVTYFLEEIFRKEQEAQTEKMIGYTKRIYCFTIIMTISTIVNVVIFICK